MTGPARRVVTTSEPHRNLITGVTNRSTRILPMNPAATPDPAPGAPSLRGAPTTTTTHQDPKSKIADEVRTLQGAGGVGGLLAISDRSNPDAQVGSSGPLDRAAPARPYRHRYPAYDANGNIGQLLDEAGEVVAAYAYDPFGNDTEMAGPEAAENPWRFSTKPVEEVTGWSYYGYRWYDAEMGRWVNRDPIEERGGVNLYGFVGNDGVNALDYLGMFGCSPCADQCDKCWPNPGDRSNCESSCRNAKLSMNCAPRDYKPTGGDIRTPRIINRSKAAIEGCYQRCLDHHLYLTQYSDDIGITSLTAAGTALIGEGISRTVDHFAASKIDQLKNSQVSKPMSYTKIARTQDAYKKAAQVSRGRSALAGIGKAASVVAAAATGVSYGVRLGCRLTCIADPSTF